MFNVCFFVVGVIVLIIIIICTCIALQENLVGMLTTCQDLKRQYEERSACRRCKSVESHINSLRCQNFPR